MKLFNVVKSKPVNSKLLPGKRLVLKPDSNVKKSTIKDELEFLKQTNKIKICVYRGCGGIGDILMATPLLRQIKLDYPDYFLTFAVDTRSGGDTYYQLVHNNPYIDSIVSAHEVKKDNYHIFKDISSVCLQYENSGLPWINRIDIFANACGFKLEEKLPVYLVEPEEDIWAKEFINKNNTKNYSNVVMLHTASYDTKRTWPIQKYVDLVGSLNKQRQDILFLVNDFQNLNPHWNSFKNVINVSSFKIRELAALTTNTSLFVGPDSGPMHLAGTLGVPGIVLFGSIPPESRINYYPTLQALTTTGLSCMPCVHPKEVVYTPQGIKTMDSLQVSDLVYDKNGDIQSIDKVYIHKNSHKMLSIQLAKTNIPLLITDNHKVPALIKVHDHKINRKKLFDITQVRDIESGKLKVGDYLFYPKTKLFGSGIFEIENSKHHSAKKLTEKISLDYDLSWFIGNYIAEGSANYSVKLTFHDNEIDTRNKIAEIGLKYFDLNSKLQKQKRCKATDIVFNSISLSKAMKKYCGNYSSDKKIPLEILNETNQVVGLLDGLFNGDGYWDGENIVLATMSKNLAYQVRELLVSIGLFPRFYSRIKKTGYGKGNTIYRIELVCRNLENRQFMVSQALKTKNICSREIVGANGYFIPIKSINEIDYTEDVYNFSVTNSHTYNVHGIAVNNCGYRSCPFNIKCMTSLSPARVIERINEII